jgi:hypothetical protein
VFWPPSQPQKFLKSYFRTQDVKIKLLAPNRSS